MSTRQPVLRDKAANVQPAPNIREQIVDRRKERIKAEGYGLGVEIPAGRSVPLTRFAGDPLVICEIKKRSPSRGAINEGMDVVAQARLYFEAGIRSVSVLTEEDHFGGNLRDLMSVKTTFPGLSVLRKDFLVDEHDVLTSYRAGADAILLIASMLTSQDLDAMLRRAEALGMSALVEVHTPEEIEKIRPLYPRLVGINCRNLDNFRLDRLLPLGLRPSISWDATVIFESGIFGYEDALYTRMHHFQGILVGESVVKKPEIIPDLIAGVRALGLAGITSESAEVQEAEENDPGVYESALNDGKASWPETVLFRPGENRGSVKGPIPAIHPKPWRFWQELSDKVARRITPGQDVDLSQTLTLAGNPRYKRPLVKICGITREADARTAVSLGADMIGFVFAESPRRATEAVVRALADLKVPRIAVVVDSVPPEVALLVREGLIDAVQLHGDERPEDCLRLAWPYYKALRIGTESDIERIEMYRSPRVLVDAYSKDLRGGTGKRIAKDLVAAIKKKTELWLAGGIGPDSVVEVIAEFEPELIDLSSALESSPGIKDESLMERLFTEIDNVCIS